MTTDNYLVTGGRPRITIERPAGFDYGIKALRSAEQMEQKTNFVASSDSARDLITLSITRDGV